LSRQLHFRGHGEVGRAVGSAARTPLNYATAPALFILICLVSACVATNPVRDDRAQRISETEFILGNIAFAMMHELAHLIISENQVPMLGSEESAADQIATIFLVRGEGVDADQTGRLRRYASMTAVAFAAMWDFSSEIGIQNPYWDDHGLSIQRYYRVLCLIHGSNPAAHPDIFAPKELPAERARACREEFEKANQAVDWLLATYGPTPDESMVVDVEITYAEPRTTVEKRLLADIQERRLIELILEAFQQRFMLQQEFSITFRSCGRAEAGWNASLRELAICYELLDAYQSLYLRVVDVE
jgi:hypothetical protein